VTSSPAAAASASSCCPLPVIIVTATASKFSSLAPRSASIPAPPSRQVRRWAREQELRPALITVLGEEDGACVVGRYEYCGLADAVGQLVQPRDQPVAVSGIRLPDIAAAHLPRLCRRCPARLVHAVNRHAETSEAANNAQAAVVHDVRVELQHHCRNASVNLPHDHTTSCRRISCPANRYPSLTRVPATGITRVPALLSTSYAPVRRRHWSDLSHHAELEPPSYRTHGGAGWTS
jgi:hypothetical protein